MQRTHNAARQKGAEAPKAPAAKKSLGQHFLRRPQLCAQIADLLFPEGQDKVLEIGPGPGALTKALESRPHSRLLLLEKDSYWAGVRKEEGAEKTEVLCMDALKFVWESLEGPWKIIGNLPYNVASPLIWDIVSRCKNLARAVFMVQKEVGERLAARPGNGHYGALSVWVQSYMRPRMEITVGPGAFSPPPKVDSAVLSFLPRAKEELPKEPKKLASILKLCFQQRRKQIGGIFKKQNRTDLLEALPALGVPETARPEELSVAEFIALSETAKQS